MSTALFKKRSIVAAAVIGVVAALFIAVAAGATKSAPSGTHLKSGMPGCSVDSSGNVSCAGFTLAGVGNTNAVEQLTATYTATVVCVNPGGNTSDSQHQGSFSSSTPPTTLTPDRNGNLIVTPLSVSAPTADQFIAQQTCPNPGWTPTLQGPITLQSFTYTLTFNGFSTPYITITGP
jgi:hypothetical protein